MHDEIGNRRYCHMRDGHYCMFMFDLEADSLGGQSHASTESALWIGY